MKKSREQLKAAFMVEAEEMFDELMEWDEQTRAPDLTQIEEKILELRKQFAEQLAQQVILRQEERQPAARVICPRCGGEMDPKGLKENQIETRIGNLEIARGYYYCPPMQTGTFPPWISNSRFGRDTGVSRLQNRRCG